MVEGTAMVEGTVTVTGKVAGRMGSWDELAPQPVSEQDRLLEPTGRMRRRQASRA